MRSAEEKEKWHCETAFWYVATLTQSNKQFPVVCSGLQKFYSETVLIRCFKPSRARKNVEGAWGSHCFMWLWAVLIPATLTANSNGGANPVLMFAVEDSSLAASVPLPTSFALNQRVLKVRYLLCWPANYCPNLSVEVRHCADGVHVGSMIRACSSITTCAVNVCSIKGWDNWDRLGNLLGST